MESETASPPGQRHRSLLVRLRTWAGIGVSVAILLAWLAWGAASSDGGPAARGVPAVHCGEPKKLRLRRLEDGSAQLYCAARLLVRVHVPW